MGFIVEVENPVNTVALCKMQGEFDVQSVGILLDNIKSLFDEGNKYFILESRNLTQVSQDAFVTFSQHVQANLPGCTFLFCSMKSNLKSKIEEEANNFSFFETERGCLDFLGTHLGIVPRFSNSEKTVERCAAATIAMTMPDNIKEMIEEEEERKKKEKE